MPIVDRTAIESPHHQVMDLWKEIVLESRTLGFVDRIVIAIQLEARAKALAIHEGLARSAGDLATEARAFATATKEQSPLTTALWLYGIASSVLGAFGLWSTSKLWGLASGTIDAAQQGAAQSAAALTGALTLASGGVIYWVIRGTAMAVQAAAEALNDLATKEHPSALLLQKARSAEEQLFSIFQQRVPRPPISAGPVLAIGAICLILGVVVAALAGIGSGST
ncbi:hypothetical protein [Kribbella endophytica]